MDNSEAAYRVKRALDISKRVRHIDNEAVPVRVGGAFDRYSDAQKIATLHKQIDELAQALRDLADYVAKRDDIDLEG